LRLPLLFLFSALRFHRMLITALQDRLSPEEAGAGLRVRADPIRLHCAATQLARIPDSASQ
jgi:hypothetical protein